MNGKIVIAPRGRTEIEVSGGCNVFDGVTSKRGWSSVVVTRSLRNMLLEYSVRSGYQDQNVAGSACEPWLNRKVRSAGNNTQLSYCLFPVWLTRLPDRWQIR